MSQIIIVGAGISGLVAALRAKAQGYDVIVFEKNEKAGGLVNSFYKDGFLFDGGTRALQGFIFALLKPLNITMDYVKTPVSIGIEDKIISMETEEGIENYKKMLEELYPDSLDDIEKIFKDIRKMGKFLKAVNKMLSVKKGFMSFFIDFIPAIVSLFANINVLFKMKDPMEKYFENKIKIKNKSLMDIITQHFFAGTPTFFALGYLYMYPDYIYPLGGTGKLAEKLDEKVKELDIEVKYSTKIVKIDAANKFIITENREKYYFDKLIWAADLKTLYRNLEIEKLSKERTIEFEKEKEKILNHKGAESIFTVYLAIDEDPKYFKSISNSHLFYTPYRKGLGSIIKEKQQNIIKNWDNLNKKEIFNWLEELCRYNTYEISIPVLKDKNAAPFNKTGLEISFLFDYTITKKAKETGFYDELKEKLTELVINILSETIYKGLKDKIIFKFSSTPLTIEEISGSSEGSVIGWSMEKPVPVNSSFLKMVEAAKTSILDIYKVGQWTMSPAGTPTAVMTGNLAISLISKNNKKNYKNNKR